MQKTKTIFDSYQDKLVLIEFKTDTDTPNKPYQIGVFQSENDKFVVLKTLTNFVTINKDRIHTIRLSKKKC